MNVVCGSQLGARGSLRRPALISQRPRCRTVPFTAQYSNTSSASFFPAPDQGEPGPGASELLPDTETCLAELFRSPRVLTGKDSSEAVCCLRPQPRLPRRRGDLIPGGWDITGHSVLASMGTSGRCGGSDAKMIPKTLHTSTKGLSQEEAKAYFPRNGWEALHLSACASRETICNV